jgi:hypothetical protein
MSFGGINKTKKEQIKYVPHTSSISNQAATYASSILKSETALANGALQTDYLKLLNNGCTYLPNFFCQTSDLTMFNQLKADCNPKGAVTWSKHHKCDDPSSETFNKIVKQMADHFKVQVVQTRLNYYVDGTDWKPLHKDNHAYGEGRQRIIEDFTMGASFGSSRTLDFVHDDTQLKFSFPQNNGDVFAFNSEVNSKFMHGVPPVSGVKGDRFSIIAWGKKL